MTYLIRFPSGRKLELEGEFRLYRDHNVDGDGKNSPLGPARPTVLNGTTATTVDPRAVIVERETLTQVYPLIELNRAR